MCAPARSPRPSATPPATSARSPRATSWASPATASGPSRPRWPAPPAACSRCWSPTTTRSLRSSKGRGRRPPTPARSPSGSTSTGPMWQPRYTTAASRSTPTCSASNRSVLTLVSDSATDTAPIALGDLASMPVTRLKGVGERKAEGLDAVGVTSLLDLLTYYPRRYVDRTNEARIGDMVVGEDALVLVTVERVASRRTRGRPPKVLVTVDVTDGSGHLRVSFFNQAWRERQLRPGMTVALFGKLEIYAGRKQMTNPVVDLIGDRTGRIVPIYPQSDKAGLSTWEIGDWVAEALRRSQVRGLLDPVPDWVLDRFDLVARREAFAGIHAPETMEHKEVARRRLVLDELLRVQLALVQRKRHIERTTRGIPHTVEGPLLDAFLGRLPFDLTHDQQAAIDEIRRDLAAPHPMHRLLQGDVGAGKTVVAVWTLLAAVEGGNQGGFMAPTEVLAEQHAQGIRALLDGVEVPDDGTSLFGARPLRAELLTNRVGAADRRRILGDLAAGQVDLVIGTHALIQEGVEFGSPGG